MASLIDARNWDAAKPPDVDAGRKRPHVVRVEAGPLRPPNGGVVGRHDHLLGPPEEAIEPCRLIDGGWQVEMGHDRCADHPTDRQRDGYVSGVVTQRTDGRRRTQT